MVNGSFTFSLGVNMTLTGQVGTGAVGNFAIWGDIEITQDANWTEIAA